MVRCVDDEVVDDPDAEGEAEGDNSRELENVEERETVESSLDNPFWIC